jgi:hypothetical protein
MFKLYIAALADASDLDETVEEKLLVGDRPKPGNHPEGKLSFAERLHKKNQEEINEVMCFDVLYATATDVSPAHSGGTLIHGVLQRSWRLVTTMARSYTPFASTGACRSCKTERTEDR